MLINFIAPRKRQARLLKAGKPSGIWQIAAQRKADRLAPWVEREAVSVIAAKAKQASKRTSPPSPIARRAAPLGALGY